MASEASTRGSLCDGDGGLTRTLDSTVRTAPHLGKRCLSAQSINWRLKRGTLQPYQESRTAPPFNCAISTPPRCPRESVIFNSSCPSAAQASPGLPPAGRGGIAALRNSVLCTTQQSDKIFRVYCVCASRVARASLDSLRTLAPGCCCTVTEYLPIFFLSLAWFLVRAAVTSRDVGETPKQHQH